MDYRRLGSSGLQVSVLSFGSWVTFGNQLDTSAARALLTCAYDAGVNFFDNAEVYADGASEEIMGRAISELGWRRDSYCVSSKVFWGGQLPTQRGLSRKHVMDACHSALRRLRVDYLDLYFCHRPDPDTPVGETVRAMHDLIAQGTVLYWGTSEWSAEQLHAAYEYAAAHQLIAPTMEQPEYNLLHRARVEREYAPLYDQYGLGTTIWSPLASGVLTGKYNDGIPADSRMTVPGYEWLAKRLQSPEGQARLARVREFTQLAHAMDTTPAQLALAWCVCNPRVSTVILGATKVEQLQQNLAALAIMPRMTADVLTRLDTLFPIESA